MTPRDSTAPAWPPRLSTGPQQDRGRRLIEAAGPPGELGEAAVARLERRLLDGASGRSKTRPGLWTLAAVGAAAAVALLVLGVGRPRPPSGGTAVLVADGAAVTLADHGGTGGGTQASAVGPTRLVPPTAGPQSLPHLTAGGLRVASGEQPTRLRAGWLELEGAPGSRFEVQVEVTRIVVVATVGQVAVISASSGRLELGPGSALTASPGGPTQIRAQATALPTPPTALPTQPAAPPAPPAAPLPPSDPEAGTVPAVELVEPATPEPEATPAPRRTSDPGPSPRPTLAPAPGAEAPTGARSPLLDETGLLGQAQQLLGRPGSEGAARALELLDEHARRFPQGSLAAEAVVTRLDALLRLGQRARALALLERLRFDDHPRRRELRVLRGELLSGQGSWSLAIGDFTAALKGDRSPLEERALQGRARCALLLGQTAAAHEDLRAYLTRFPAGPFAARARTELGRAGEPAPLR